MSRELPSVATPVTLPELANATLLVWDCSGESPSRRAAELFLAHVVHECGLEKCRCFNLGGTKASAGGRYNWQYFTTREVVPVSEVETELALGAKLEVLKKYQRNGVEVASVFVHPRHRWCCFRAYESLDEASRDQVKLIHARPAAWAALQTGEPIAYAGALRAAKYFTADPAEYATSLARQLNSVRTQLRDWDGWGDVT